MTRGETADTFCLAVLENARGEVLMTDIRFIEGWTFRQLRATIDAHADLQHDTRALSEAELLSRIGATERSPEGLFFPDTYHFSPGASDLEIYRNAYRRMRKALDDAWAARAPDLPLSNPYEALVLASIVEKETGRADERPQVASVFLNRLQNNMRLQSDPTVIYGLGLGAEARGHELTRADLDRATPYNTYVITGLPPTPICNPGRAAVLAVLHPAPSDDLYFVANGTGGHAFAASLEDHARNVAHWRAQSRKSATSP